MLKDIKEPVNVGKKYLVNEGDFLNGESQIDSLSFCIATPMGFSIPSANNNGFLHVQRT